MKEQNAREMLQTLGKNRYCKCALSIQEKCVHANITADHNYSKEVETASLEAERRKTEGIMEIQRRGFV